MPVISLPVYLRRAVSMERTENFAENALTLLMITVRRRMAIHFFFFLYLYYVPLECIRNDLPSTNRAYADPNGLLIFPVGHCVYWHLVL